MNNLWLHPNNTCFIKSYFTFAYININLISTLFFFQFTLIMATEESIMYHLLLYISLELKHQFKSEDQFFNNRDNLSSPYCVLVSGADLRDPDMCDLPAGPDPGTRQHGLWSQWGGWCPSWMQTGTGCCVGPWFNFAHPQPSHYWCTMGCNEWK